MSITGHKSVQSLTRYQKTQDKEKIAMGHVMNQSMTRTEDEISVPGRKALENKPIPKAIEGNVTVNVASNAVTLYTTPNSVVQKENVSDNIVPFENNIEFGDDVPNFDLLQMITQMEKEQNISTTVSTATTSTTSSMVASSVLNNVTKSLFHNCTIQNVTFNMPK